MQPPMEVSRRGRWAQSRALPAPIPTVGNNHIGSSNNNHKNNNYINNNINNNMKKVESAMNIPRINAPDHRFTATHGVALAKGSTKEFV